MMQERNPDWGRLAEVHRHLAQVDVTFAFVLVLAGGILLVAAFTLADTWRIVPLALGTLSIALACLFWAGYEENVERAEGLEALGEEWRDADPAMRRQLLQLALSAYGRTEARNG